MLDTAILQKTDAQLIALQGQFQLELQKAGEPLNAQLQEAAEAIAKEQQDVIAKVCAEAKLAYQVGCEINLAAGTVSKSIERAQK